VLKIRYLLPVLLLCSAVFSLSLPGCKPREEELQTSGGLAFSADTVKFDTVFTTLRTVTKRLWVYNRNPRAVNVDLVSLENSATSPYTLIINGDLKQTATNLYIRGNDSLLILVRAKLNDNGGSGRAKDLVVQEKLNFRTNGQEQAVLLRSFGQNIYLHQNVALACGATGIVWTNDRPHVLYGTVEVPVGCTLRIKPGTRIYAHAGAALIVRGTLLVNAPSDYQPGTGPTDTVKATNPNLVRFAGDRSGETQYATAPGQWTGILFDATSRGNVIRYAQIQNAAYGALLFNPANNPAQPDLLLQNSIIRYISGASANFAGAATQLASYNLLPGVTEGAGILSFSGKVTAENTLFSDCYEYALRGYGGGSYSLNYCTIANYPATAAVRKTASLTFTNLSALDGTPRNPSGLTLNLQNSIVWGASSDELYLENYGEYKAGVSVRNTLLRSQLYAATTDASGVPGLKKSGLNNLVNEDPKFVRPGAGTSSDYRPGAGSPALASKTAVPPPVPRDLLNLPRSQNTPDLGAYRVTKP
jgi:hypothetical protein